MWAVEHLRLGTPYSVLLLLVAAVAVALGGALLILLLELGSANQPLRGGEALWESLIRTLDPGQLALDDVTGSDGGAKRWGFAVVALLVTLGGLLLVSSLVSIINNNVERTIERADLGRARAASRRRRGGPRYVILGWTDVAPRLLEEIARSGDPRRPPAVLVMAEVELRQMEQRVRELRDELGDSLVLKRRWPEFRTGSAVDRRDLLERAAVHDADAVVILAPDPSPTSAPGPAPLHGLDVDAAQVVRKLFATASVVEAHHSAGAAVRIVVELPETTTASAELSRRIESRFTTPTGARGAIEVVTVDSREIQARLAGQVVRKPGLSEVYEDLLTFKDAEIRVVDNPGFETFWDAVSGAADASVMGLVDDAGASLWPKWDEGIGSRRLAVVAHDGGSPRRGAPSASPSSDRPERPVAPAMPDGDCGSDDVLVVGWNSRGPDLIRALDNYLDPAAKISVVTDHSEPPVQTARSHGTGDTATVAVREVDDLQTWLDGDDPLRDAPHAIVLGDDRMSAEASDAHVLLALESLHPPGRPHNPGTVVAELRLRSSRHLPSQHEHSDLIVGDGLVPLLLAHYAVDRGSRAVLTELTDLDGASGVEFDLVPPPAVPPSTFAELVEVQAQSGRLAVGFRTAPRHAGRHPQLVLNPAKTDDLRSTEIVDVVVLTRRPDPATGASPTRS